MRLLLICLLVCLVSAWAFSRGAVFSSRAPAVMPMLAPKSAIHSLHSAPYTAMARLASPSGGILDVDDGGAWTFIKRAFSKSGALLAKLLRDPSYRQELLDMISIRWRSVFRNLRMGEVGRRGEEWLLAQMVLLAFILLGINPLFVFFIRLLGLGVGGFGAYMMIRAAWILKENLSPFPVPVENHYLVTSDLYEVVRHPLYGGLILVCVGVSLVTNSCDRLIFTLVLAALLGSKADREEEELSTLHPGLYLSYVGNTKQKFIPYLL